MAWRNGARLTSKFIKGMNRKWHALRPENPRGIPKVVMRALANEQLSSDPVAFNLRLQQLLALHELSKRGGQHDGK